LQPHMGPPVPLNERFTFKQKLVSLKNLILPVLIVLSVLGSVFAGICTPTEGAACGVAGALICTAIKKRFSWALVKEASIGTMKVSAMMGWLIVGALVYAKVYNGLGATQLVSDILNNSAIGPYGVIAIMMFIWFIMGFFLDDTAMLFITAPIFIPIVQDLGFNLVWFGILYVVSVQMALLTPPFGYNLFLIRAVAPKDITMSDIYRSVWPFVTCQACFLVLLIVFPQIALWLPGRLITP
jgi:tripartite ATP-independent transporter DctM subunit